MGFKCDVCTTGEGAVFCFADNAVMCQGCDGRLHVVGKEGGAHDRVALQREEARAQCDICQEAPAVMFCSEDRALICRTCDIMIHTANEHTAKHKRFLLSGLTAGLHALPCGCNSGHASGKGAREAAGVDVQGMMHKVESLGQLISPAAMNGATTGATLLDLSPVAPQAHQDTSANSSCGAASPAVSDASGGLGCRLAPVRTASPDKDSVISSAAQLSSELANELLNLPLPEGKDVFFGESPMSFAAFDDWSSLLEVPDFSSFGDADTPFAPFSFPDAAGKPLKAGGLTKSQSYQLLSAGSLGAFELPSVSVRDPAALMGRAGGPASPACSDSESADCVVPELGRESKRRRR